MITAATLTNFRQHRDLSITLERGLTAIRGANEAGKSTLLEAISYALFGTKAVRGSLDDAVTWGEPVSTLHVSITIQSGGQAYTFNRGKSGAEVVLGGKVFVTGQAEVSKFAAGLLGADLNTSARLMIASQKNLSDALSQGPKATSELIEYLASFNLFDELIEAMQEHLVLGSPAQFQQAVEQSQGVLEQLGTLAPPDTQAMDLEAETLQKQSVSMRQHAHDVLSPARKVADAAVESEKTAVRAREGVVRELAKVQESVGVQVEQRVAALAKAAQCPPPEEITALRLAVQEVALNSQKRKAYQEMLALVDRCDTRIPITLGAATKEHAGLVEEHRAAATQFAKLQAEANVWAARRVVGDECPTCGSDLRHAPKTGKINAEVVAKLQELSTLSSEQGSIMAATEQRVAVLGDLLKLSSEVVTFFNRHHTWVDVTDECPPTLSWVGPVPDESDQDAQQNKNRLSALEEQKEQAERAGGRAEALAEAIARDRERIAQLDEQLANLPAPKDLDALKAAAAEADKAVWDATEQADQLIKRSMVLSGEAATLRQAYANHAAQVAAAATRLKEAEASLREVEFNNTLLKKVRQARPIIADKLWNTVLAAVSQLFSSLREEPSTVSKDKDGFKVNGKPVEPLAGSALDLLGLSMRVALAQTFLPDCPFLIVDEPASACDRNRSNMLLGFLSNCGFDQVVMVTHDEDAEVVADHVITL